MYIKNIFRLSALSTALFLAGCGSDINITPSTVDNSVDNSVTDNSVTGNDRPEPNFSCASYTQNGQTFEGTITGDDCVYTKAFASDSKEITSDLYVPAIPGRHIFQGSLFIGDDTDVAADVPETGAILTIEAGSTLVFTDSEAYVRIARGSKILAEGSVDKPILFTSDEAFEDLDTVGNGPQYKDWGGIMINGLGINNKCTTAERDGMTCSLTTEGAVSYYGGNKADDSSGVLKYVGVYYAGSGPKQAGDGDDLNSLSLYAVGSGTEIDYIHIHEGYDDGIELFGGSVSLKHLVLTHNQDDSLDWDEGWTGMAQHIMIKHGEGLGNHGFETDGAKSSPAGQGDTDESASNPIVANVTVVSNATASVRDGDESRGIMMREWGMGQLANLLITNPSTEAGHECFELQDKKDKTDVDGVIANAQAGKISVSGSVIACGTAFDMPSDAGNATFDIEAWWLAGDNNFVLTQDATVYAADGYRTAATITDKDGNPVAVQATDMNAVHGFFDQTSHIGAIAEGDTDSDWAKWVDASMAVANGSN